MATSVARKGPAFDALKKVETFQARTFYSTPRTERSAPVIADAEVTKLFSLWNDALATLDPDTVAKRYASKSVLLPTVSDVPRTDYAGLKSYFETFLKMKPQGVILESNVIQGEDWCMDAGIYEFTMGANVSFPGSQCLYRHGCSVDEPCPSGILSHLLSFFTCQGNIVRARYTYVYVYEGGEWKIAHHHSSMMPEQFL